MLPSGRRSAGRRREATRGSPLAAMTPIERVTADYEGTGLTIGRIRCRSGAPTSRCAAWCVPSNCGGCAGAARESGGRRHHAAAARDGEGFVFLTLEDETGIAEQSCIQICSIPIGSSSSANRSARGGHHAAAGA